MESPKLSVITGGLGLFLFLFVTCVLLVIKKHYCFPEFFNGLMGVHSFANVFGFMPHEQVGRNFICASRVESASESMAALVRGVLNSD